MCVCHDIGPRIYIYRGPIDEEDETVDASIFLWPSRIDSAGTMSKAERISISNCQLEFSGLVWGFSGVTENRRISLLIQMGPEESPGMLGFCGCLLRTEKDHDLWWCKVFFCDEEDSKCQPAALQLMKHCGPCFFPQGTAKAPSRPPQNLMPLVWGAKPAVI